MAKRVAAWSIPVLALAAAALCIGFYLGQTHAPYRVGVQKTEAEAVVERTDAAQAAVPQEEQAAPAEMAEQIDLNTATAEELQRLPGVGEVIAERIIAYRTACGGFLNTEQLMEVSGIGEAKYEKLKDHITVGERNENSGS